MHFQLVLATVGSVLMLTNAARITRDNEDMADVVERDYPDTGQVKQLSKSERDEFVAYHQQIRSNVPKGASDMENIEWDADLATKASAWVAKCYFEHPKTQYSDEAAYVTPGQNLYLDTQIKTSPPTPTYVVNQWKNEVQWYDINGNSCSAPAGKSCGHYVQVVYSTARKVGCAMAYCNAPKDRDGTVRSAGWLAACNYETGVTTNTAPYQIGSACTKCSNGKFFCKDKLCVDKCKGSDSDCTCNANCGSNGVLQQGQCSCKCNVGFAANDCSETCEDKDEKCVPKYDGTPFWPKSWCTTKDYVKEKCPKLCKTCEAAPVPPEKCEDKDERCVPKYDGTGYWPKSWCKTQDYVKEACPKLCETCEAAPAPAEPCVNKAGGICIPNTEGRPYYSPEYCQTNPDFMKANCKKQCGFCT